MTKRVCRMTSSLGLLLALAGTSYGQHSGVPRADRDEIRAIVAEAMADAQTRSSLLAGADSGHDGKFFISSGDGNYRLNVGGGMLFRYYANFRSDDNASGLAAGDDFESGFQNRLTTLNFSGNIVDPTWNYFIEGGFKKDDGSFNLRDMYVAKKANDNWTILWGQIKAHMLREENIPEKYQLAVDRSVTNSVFSQGRSQAIAGVYTNENIMFVPVFSDGAATEDTDFTSSAESDYAFSGRLSWKGAGEWSQFDDFTSPRGSETAWMVGAAAHYQESANTPAPTDTDVEVFLYTVDATIQGDGWNAFGAFIGRNIDADSLSSSASFDDFGFVVQGGFRMTDIDEIFGRYDVVIPDDERSGDPDPFSTLTFGWNRYMAGQAAKFTADVQWSFDEIDTTALVSPTTDLGLLGDDDGGEVVIRLQFQLLF